MNNKSKKLLDVNRVLREKLIFQKRSDDGPFVGLDDYEDYITVRGEVNHYRSRLVNQGRAENTREALVFIIRYRTDINNLMRIIYNNEPYEIQSIAPLTNENLYLEITAYKFSNDFMGDML